MKALHDLGRLSSPVVSFTGAYIESLAAQMRGERIEPQPYQRAFADHWLGYDYDGRAVQMDLDRQIHHLEMALGRRRYSDRIALRVNRGEWHAMVSTFRPEEFRQYLGEEGTSPPMYRGYPVLVL